MIRIISEKIVNYNLSPGDCIRVCFQDKNKKVTELEKFVDFTTIINYVAIFTFEDSLGKQIIENYCVFIGDINNLPEEIKGAKNSELIKPSLINIKEPTVY